MSVLRKTFAVAAAVSLVCLSSVGAMAANKLIVMDSAGTTPKFVVTDTGYIGGGTDTPAAGINLVGVSSLSSSQIRSHYVGTNANGGGGFIGLHNNGTTSALTLPVTGNRIGYFYFGSLIGPIGAPTSIPLGAGVTVRAEANWSASSAPTYFTFDTAAANQIQPVEKMRITSTGNVGIGTTAPATKLDVSGGIRINSTTSQPACSSANRGTLWLVQGSTDNLQICAQVGGGSPVWRNVTLQ